MGLISAIKWPVDQIIFQYRTSKATAQYRSAPDPANIIGRTALMPAHDMREQPTFGGANLQTAQTVTAQPTLVHGPSMRSAHGIFETATDAIVEEEHSGQISAQGRLAGSHAYYENGGRKGHAEQPDNLHLQRSHAVRRKPLPAVHRKPLPSTLIALNPDLSIERSGTPFSFLLPAEPLPCSTKIGPSEPQLKRTGAIRRKRVLKYSGSDLQKCPQVHPRGSDSREPRYEEIRIGRAVTMTPSEGGQKSKFREHL